MGKYKLNPQEQEELINQSNAGTKETLCINWFEKNQTKSVITYSIFLVAATWGAMQFIFNDNRVNLVRAELESQKAISEQYKVKLNILQSDLEDIRGENAEYKSWLEKDESNAPLLLKTVVKLRKENVAANAEYSKMLGVNALTPIHINNSELNNLNEVSEKDIRPGVAYISDDLNLAITVYKTNTDKSAKLGVRLPGKDGFEEWDVNAGSIKRFNYKDNTYSIIINSIVYYNDSVVFSIK